MGETNVGSVEGDWPENYFNYFTEIEEHFRQARGTGLFLLSPLDWALIENWRSAGVPLQTVLKGIDAAFDKWHSRKSRGGFITSLVYCARVVRGAAQRARRGKPGRGGGESAFPRDEFARFLGSTETA